MLQHEDRNKRGGRHASRRSRDPRYRRRKGYAHQVTGSGIGAIVTILGGVLADARSRVTARTAVEWRSIGEALMTGGAALRIDEQIHGAGRACRIGSVLGRLAMEPHVGKIKGQAEYR